MDLSTTYLGLKLAHPLMPGASPMATDLDIVRRLEDAGASAIVMNSLFEEQISRRAVGLLPQRRRARRIVRRGDVLLPAARSLPAGSR